jgi:uncharacterized membrane protein
MGIAFEAPLLLLLFIPAIIITVVLHIAARRRLGAGRRRIALVIRSMLLAALVLGLAGLQIVLPVNRLATVFVLDLSDSIGSAGREDALAFVRTALEEMPKDDVAGIVAFGKEALVERLPSDLQEIDRIASAPVRSATDIGGALRLATALFPDDAQKRIVLLSDGNDTTGTGQAEAALSAARGVRIETRQIGLGASDEVLIERASSPSTSRLGEEIEVVSEIRSSVAQPATVRLFVNGTQAGEPQRLDLEEGANTVTFSYEPVDAGFHRFRVVVEAGRDTFSQNNRADSNTIVQGEPRTLVLAGDEVVADDLVEALESQRHKVDTIVPETLPELDQLLDYDSVVLVDVPRIRLNDRQLATLQAYVRDLGRGLVMVGGPRSYGAGGYQDTALEETLPVDMGVRDRQKQPDVALVVVIDKSGSMDACHCNTFGNGQGGGTGIGGVKKTDIGKEAILRAAAALTDRDELGIVAFNEQAHWVVHTQPLGNVGDLQGAIAGIRPDGQTNIFEGLEAAVDELENTTATRRHIILLTDGWSSTGQYADLLERMAAAGITLSTVGAGGGSQNQFLAGLAEEGGGRYYEASNPASIPDIFLKETQQVSGQQIVEEKFFPIVTSSSPILRGLDQGFPELRGYNGTTAKPAAQTVLVTARDDPLLAQWQYGLGRSVAWTSDSTGRWAADWVGWNGFNRFFSQLVSWTFPGEESGGIEASFVTDGANTKLRVESLEEDGKPRDFFSTTAAIVGPTLEGDDVDLVQVAPGVYEQDLGEIEPGAYSVRVTQTRPGTAALGRTLGLVSPTAAEYRILGANEPFLAALRGATGGIAIEDPAQVWTHDLTSTSRFTDLWPILLILALILWPLDIAFRRVSVGRRELAAARGWVTGAGRRRKDVAPRPAVSEGLLAARNRASSSGARSALRAEPEAAPSVATTATATAASPPAKANPTKSSQAPAPSPAPAATEAPPPPKADPKPVPPASASSDTLARLRDAKRRARER